MRSYLLRSLLLFAVAMAILSSCVPNRKYVYMQKNDVREKNIPTDSVLRTYGMYIDEYRIQPLDLLFIRIESLTEEDYDFIDKLYPIGQQGVMNPNMQMISGFLVDNKGEIEFPVVGKIKFSGLTIFEAQVKLQDQFKTYLKDPVARVRLLNFRFTVLGEVKTESQVVSDNTRVTIMEAIGKAGGLTDLADRSKVKIVRQKGATSEVFYVNLLEEEIVSSKHYYIQQNDIIVVPALRQRPYRNYVAPNISIILSVLSLTFVIINLVTPEKSTP